MEEPLKNKRYNGSFECRTCKQKWSNPYAWLGVPQKCKWCQEAKEAVSFYLLKNKAEPVRFPFVNKRYFGFFECLDCGINWPSASSFDNFKQACKACDVSYFAYELWKFSPKESGESSKPDIGNKMICEFLCRHCNKRWRHIAIADEDTSSKCSKCENICSATRFFKLKLSQKQHMKEKCEKCLTASPCEFE